MNFILPFVVALALILVTGCGDDNSTTIHDNSRIITEADYGDAWPLTVPEATLICEAPVSVILKVGSNYYGVNGIGTTYVEREYPSNSGDLESIWRADPGGIIPRMNIGPLIDDGLELCK